MLEKRKFVLFSYVLCILIVLPLISAQYGQGNYFYSAQGTIRPVLESALGILAPIFQFAVGDYSNNEIFLVKILLMFLLIVIISTILKTIPQFMEMSDIVINTISIIVSILAIRFMGQNQLILGILLPYGTLGTAILMLLPFMLWFYFIHQSNMSSGMRKFSWGFFMIIFFIFWNSRFDQMGALANQIYGWGLMVMILVLIFDRSIHRYFRDAEVSNRYKANIEDQLVHYRDLHRQAANSNDIRNMKRYEAIMKKLSRRI